VAREDFVARVDDVTRIDGGVTRYENGDGRPVAPAPPKLLKDEARLNSRER